VGESGAFCVGGYNLKNQNDLVLFTTSQRAKIVVAAWGEDGVFNARDEEVLRFINKAQCLKVNKDDTPAHPLFQKAKRVLQPMGTF
jgi:hypothetical protein